MTYAPGDRVTLTNEVAPVLRGLLGRVLYLAGPTFGVIVVRVDGHPNSNGLWFGPEHIRMASIIEEIGKLAEPDGGGSSSQTSAS